MSSTIQPNFLIIGAAKSGTTSLYRYLQQHPEIYMPLTKETNFFAYEGKEPDFRWWGEPPSVILKSVTKLDRYRSLFANVTSENAIGEASPLYLYDTQAPGRIKHYIPEAKMIAILRHPAERAFSHYSHLLRDNREPCTSFAEALQAEEKRMQDNWVWDYYYRDMGFYYKQLLRYYALFDPAQIKVFLFEELKNDIETVLADIFRFLGVDHTFKPETSFRYNVSGIPKNRSVHNLISNPSLLKRWSQVLLPKRVRRRITMRVRDYNFLKITIDPETRRELTENYAEDIMNLQKLIHMDLSTWLL